MKRLLILALTMAFALSLAPALSPSAALAQQPPGMDPAQMQEMMKKFQDPAAMQKLQEQAQAASRCMESIDQDELQSIQTRAQSASKEIEELCAAGKTDEALRQGLKLGQELKDNATVKKLGECSKHLGDAMKDMPWANMTGVGDIDSETTPTRDNICS